MRRVTLAEGECYHVYNRGVEKRTVFTVLDEYERFLYLLGACNDQRPLVNTWHTYRGRASLEELRQMPRNPLVDILCFCLMPNHYHLVLQARRTEGVPVFMQKLGTAYTMFFNAKHEREGVLFQGRYKAIHVPDDAYLLALTRYIHLNPLDLQQPGWKEEGIQEPRRAHVFLAEYPWSSYGDYLGLERYDALLSPALLRGMFKGPRDFATFVEHVEPADLRAIEVQPR